MFNAKKITVAQRFVVQQMKTKKNIIMTVLLSIVLVFISTKYVINSLKIEDYLRIEKQSITGTRGFRPGRISHHLIAGEHIVCGSGIITQKSCRLKIDMQEILTVEYREVLQLPFGSKIATKIIQKNSGQILFEHPDVEKEFLDSLLWELRMIILLMIYGFYSIYKEIKHRNV